MTPAQRDLLITLARAVAVLVPMHAQAIIEAISRVEHERR